MGSSNAETVLATYESYNRGDLDDWLRPYADRAVIKDHPRSLSLSRPEELRAWKSEFKKASPDDCVTDPRITDGEDMVLARFVARGTNDGPLGPFPATGRKYSVPVCEIFRFDSQGRIVEQDVYYDRLSLLLQLGHAEMPGELTATKGRWEGGADGR